MQVTMDFFVSAPFAKEAYYVLVVRKAIWIFTFLQKHQGTILVKGNYVLVIALVW